MTAFRLAALSQSPLIRKPLRALPLLLAVIVAFAIGVGVYAIAHALWPSLLVWWPWLLAGVSGVVILGAWWLWWQLPKRQAESLRSTMPDTKARADVEDNFRKTAGQAIGGMALLIGAGVTYLQFQYQQYQLQEQIATSRALLIGNQVSKGFDQLGSKEIETRLGGIYLLEGVMKTSDQYYRPILEALSAFVRNHTKADTTETQDGPPAADVQAALTVIGRRVMV